jgi:sulfate adenylyltransferase subunit 2
MPYEMSHLDALESEAVHIIREVAAEFERPVLLFSGGKDSIVLLRLAQKAFRPARIPFPLMHVDTGHNFAEVLELRDQLAAELDARLIVASVPKAIQDGRIQDVSGIGATRNRLQTSVLLDAIEENRFDAAFGGARRDEERSRAKERVFSFRDEHGQWDPKSQRPELWGIYNARIKRGEQVRVFPISNWTELDVWQYIHMQQVPIVPLYLARPRPVVRRDGRLIMVDDERLPLAAADRVETLHVRFRTLGCYPLTGATLSSAATVPAVIREMLATKTSEREGRGVDKDGATSLEKRKHEGYF